MHKIDRDKLREAVNIESRQQAEEFFLKYGVFPEVLNRAAAENWLEISDPATIEKNSKVAKEPTWEMLRAGLDAAIEDNEYLEEYINTDNIEAIFKAMIAKAGE